MIRYIKKAGRMVLHPRMALHWLVNSRYLRRLFIYRIYRRPLEHAEYIVSLMRKESNLDESYWIGMLRKCAHVVDKGLHRGDFSKGHGISGYKNVKRILSKIKTPEGLCDPIVLWAMEKVGQYEKLQACETKGLKSEYVETVCSYEHLSDAIKTRRSIRCYSGTPVTGEVIDKITDVLDWAPTSCHRQPVRIYASNNPEIVRKCLELHAGAACFIDIGTPLFMMFCADTRLYSMPDELFAPHIDTALGVQNCMLAAHTLGVSLTLLNCSFRSKSEEGELRRIFSIPQHFQIIVSAAGGYPDCGALVPPRKIKELIIV